MTTRRRAYLGNNVYLGKWEGYNAQGVNTVHIGNYTSNFCNSGVNEMINTTNHHWIDRRRRRSFRDLGGDFTLLRGIREYGVQWVDASSSSSIKRDRYTGYKAVDAPSNYALPVCPVVPTELSDSVLIAKGTTAWARFKPTASHGGLGQALGELHDLPHLPRLLNLRHLFSHAPPGPPIRLGRYGRLAGSEYLNVVFGWLPLVSDLRDLARNTLDLGRRLAQLERDNDRPIRRSGIVDSSRTVTSNRLPLQSVGVPSLNSSMYVQGYGWTDVTTTKQYDYRFSARFRYHINFAAAHGGNGDFDGLPEALQLTRIAYGLEINPYVLWQLMPWSWLIDWFSNTGDIINNLVHDAGDNLVADYAYINGKYSLKTVTTHNFRMKNADLSTSSPDVQISKTDTKEVFRRIHATPYGFGLTLAGLSASRLAILAALGLTRLR